MPRPLLTVPLPYLFRELSPIWLGELSVKAASLTPNSLTIIFISFCSSLLPVSSQRFQVFESQTGLLAQTCLLHAPCTGRNRQLRPALLSYLLLLPNLELPLTHPGTLGCFYFAQAIPSVETHPGLVTHSWGHTSTTTARRLSSPGHTGKGGYLLHL